MARLLLTGFIFLIFIVLGTFCKTSHRGDKESKDESALSDAELGIRELSKTLKDPSLLQEALQMLKDPEIAKEASC